MAWLALVCLPVPGVAQAAWFSREAPVMGTEIRVEVEAPDPKQGEAAIAAVLAEMRRVDTVMSPFKPGSLLSRVNREAAHRPVRITPELYRLIARALDYSGMSGGAFDITFSSVGYLYDYRKGIAPTAAALARGLPAVNYRHVRLDLRRGTVRFAHKGVRIDLGGIAKGHAVDRAIALLRQRGIQNAIVTAGGDTGILGTRPDRPWTIGIRDPRDRDGIVAVLPIEAGAVSTSGDYERYFEREGVRYHHILNPKTGRSAEGVRSVTILGPDATTTDALSTSVFVLGPEEGFRLLARLPGIEAVMLTGSGEMRTTPGLSALTSSKP